MFREHGVRGCDNLGQETGAILLISPHSSLSWSLASLYMHSPSSASSLASNTEPWICILKQPLKIGFLPRLHSAPVPNSAITLCTLACDSEFQVLHGASSPCLGCSGGHLCVSPIQNGKGHHRKEHPQASCNLLTKPPISLAVGASQTW